MKNSISLTQEQAKLLKTALIHHHCGNCSHDEDFLCTQCPVVDLEKQLNAIILNEEDKIVEHIISVLTCIRDDVAPRHHLRKMLEFLLQYQNEGILSLYAGNTTTERIRDEYGYG